jgi:hypothetical protein
MSKDTGSESGRRVFWLAVANLFVNATRLLLDLIRKG